MGRQQLNFWESERLTFDEAVDLTVESIMAHALKYDHWVFAWSGGKDSTTLVTLVVSLIEAGQLPKPKSITVLLADTRMEFPPLWFSAMDVKAQLEQRGIDVRIVMSDLDKRFFVYMLGRGVPPPNNNTFRWCTPNIKIAPMEAEIDKIYKEFGTKVLLFTGVRIGESAARDRRIALSCTRDGAECGQGWFQEYISADKADKLAPIVHFRVCSVWDWLRVFAPSKKYGGWKTQLLAVAYGGEEAEEINARTGCNGCPLTDKDTAIDGVLATVPEWGYLQPLKELRPVYRQLRLPNMRLRKTEPERNADGQLARNQNRMGPLTMDARAWALDQLLSIQKRINDAATLTGMPTVDLINDAEVARVRELWSLNTWPEKWTGREQRADLPFTPTFSDGSVQLTIDDYNG
jgi:DNA sulfur modification protein DndC